MRLSLNILLIAYGRANEQSSYTHRILEMTRTLSGSGHKVTLLWFSPATKIWPHCHLDELKKKAKVLIFPVPPLFSVRGIDVIGRAICSVVIKWVSVIFKTSIIHAETALAAHMALKAVPNLPVVVDLHGDVTAEMAMQGRPKWCIARTEQDTSIAIRYSTAAIVVSEGLAQVIRTKTGRSDIPVTVLPCSVNIERFSCASGTRSRIRSSIGADNRFVVAYCGGLDVWQCITESLNIVQQLRERLPEIFFLFLTAGNITPWQKELSAIGHSGLDYLVKSLQPAEVPSYLSGADCGLLIRKDDPVNAVASPTKLGEYLAAGVPVITTKYAGDAPLIISRTGCGYVLPSNHVTESDIENLVQFIKTIKGRRDDLSRECIEAAKHYHSWNNSSTELIKLYHSF